jgi:RNA polymerase sigma factor (sigma-70 family)
MSFTKAHDDDLLGQYLRDIGRYPLLSRDEEVRLAQEIEAGVAAEEQLHDDAAVDLLSDPEEIAKCGQRARQTFVRANLRLVVCVAKQYSGSGVPLTDIIQEGNLGLMHAVEKFDWRMGFKFSTYATWWIRQAITRGIPLLQRPIRLPQHAHDALARVRAARANLYSQLNRAPTLYELAETVDLPPVNVELVLQFDTSPLSLSDPLGADGDAIFADVIEDRSAESPFDTAVNAIVADTVEHLLSSLSERDAHILRLRFGLDDRGDKTLQQVADELGVSRERIRQIEARALKRLRECFMDDARELLAS